MGLKSGNNMIHASLTIRRPGVRSFIFSHSCVLVGLGVGLSWDVELSWVKLACVGLGRTV